MQYILPYFTYKYVAATPAQIKSTPAAMMQITIIITGLVEAT